MTTVADLRASGTDITTASMPMPEPINAQEVFGRKLSRFGDNYNLSGSSHLYRFLVALCGEAGAGSVKKEMLIPRLQQQLDATHFNDIDRLYGNSLGLPRLAAELYPYDPYNDILDTDSWHEIGGKDASYRERCLLWMRAIIEGPTPVGLALAAQAATGVECDVFERYRYLDNAASDLPITVPNIGATNSRNEFVIIPREPTVSEPDKRRIHRLLDQLRPMNTILSIASGSDLRTSRGITDVAASSERFNVLRYVTGRPDVDWPDLDASSGYWIEGDVEHEAPSYAFMDRQESVTYLTITDCSSSTVHVGSFNREQASLFSHLSAAVDPLNTYDCSKAYSKLIAPVAVSMPWTANDQLIVNNFYPIGYFAQEGVAQFTSQSPQDFWASIEQLPPNTETLTLDMGRTRPVNFIDFEICQKPIDFIIEYSTDGTTWAEVTTLDGFPVDLSVSYLPSLDNPWHYFEMHFNLVQARYIRLTFTRREDRFPLITSDYFAFSIDVRGLRLMNVIASLDDFIADSGTDVLGNSYRTDTTARIAVYTTDNDDTTYWQSQPNPSRSAVEALYFDLRTGLNTVTMAYLNGFPVSEIDTWSQNELDNGHYEDGTVIDEIWIDPVTTGSDLNIYYSLDDTPDWDEKLWIPIPQRYILKRSYFALPSPTFVKFVKLEFTNLTAVPYQPIEYPNIPPVEFRRYPTWVQNYFDDLYPVKPLNDNVIQFDRISIEPLTFSFLKADDALDASFETIRSDPDVSDDDERVKTFIDAILSGTTVNSTDMESKIKVRSPIMWQQDLIAQLDKTRALSRVAATTTSTTDTGFNAELTLPVSDPPVQQSQPDLTQAYVEKSRSRMFFPYRCRHGYQIVKASFTNKIAYQVAIKTVGFYRRNYNIVHDDAEYVETLGDTAHVALNDFTDDGWRFVVTP